ncbi:hypothetical protein [Photorhabdus caribbeanensis]|uniref:hypothetical protein n=1 Tax=Photorhabdus caribbeanensis TaxID=1004165 RepID=UPI001BD282F9|nr:hypothetical protein [Photorhabdus caribbeanensis]
MKILDFKEIELVSGGGGAPASVGNAAGVAAIAGAIAGIPGGPAGVAIGAAIGAIGVAAGSTVPSGGGNTGSFDYDPRYDWPGTESRYNRFS